MKKMIYTVMAIAVFALQGMAQTDAISKFFTEYDNRDDITQITLSGKAFELTQQMKFEDKEAEHFRKIASQVTGLRMVIDDADSEAKNTALRAKKSVSGVFEDLVTIKDKDASINVMVNEANGVVSEVLAIVGTSTDFILISLTGNMRLEDVGALTKQFSTVNKDIFASTPVNPGNVLIYPNPVRLGAEVIIELPESLNGGNVRIFNVAGKEVMSYTSASGKKNINVNELGKGVFVLKAQKGEIEATKKFIVQ